MEGAKSLDSDIGKAGVVFTVTVYWCLKLVFFWLQWCPGGGGSYEPGLWYREGGVVFTVTEYWCLKLFSFDCSGALVVEGAKSLNSDIGKAGVVFTVTVYWCLKLFSFDCSVALVVEGAMSRDSDIGKAGVVFTVTVYWCLKLVFFWLQWCPGGGGSYEPGLWYREGWGSIYCNCILMSETCFLLMQWCPGGGGSYEPRLWYREGWGSIYCNCILMSETCSFDCSGALVVEGAKSLDSDIGKAGVVFDVTVYWCLKLVFFWLQWCPGGGGS